uniref:Bm1183, isoform a n=1 Tax=Brugia malayi TaxID=6279 RepID=A0A1I9G0F9_BRUMA|nr:Bm1183, isoform a [Brugia malayi]
MRSDFASFFPAVRNVLVQFVDKYLPFERHVAIPSLLAIAIDAKSSTSSGLNSCDDEERILKRILRKDKNDLD